MNDEPDRIEDGATVALWGTLWTVDRFDPDEEWYLLSGYAGSVATAGKEELEEANPDAPRTGSRPT